MAQVVLTNAGVPSAGTSEVQTLTIGGTPTSGTIEITYQGVSASFTWSATNNTLVANMQTALDTLFGASNTIAAVGTMTAGIGTITVTFAVALGKLAVDTIDCTSHLSGSSPTAAIAETTPGVTATWRGKSKGQLVTDTTNGILYINTGTSTAPTWTKVGTQT